jgi:hypothetical protein
VASGVLVTVPRERRRGRAVALLARVRWPLVAIVAVGAALTIWFVLQCVQYFIQPDELEYLKQSRQIASELHPLVPGDAYFTSWSQLQPLLLAPVWGLIHDTNSAHKVMGVVNALIMASAAIPAYLLALRVVADRRLAYLVALLTVVVPWMAAAATMMTEVAAYPAFLWAALAVQHAIARPSARGDVIGVAGVALAYFARPQLAVLGVALVVGLLVQEVRYAEVGADPLARRRDRIVPGLRAAIVRHRWLLGAGLAAVIVYVIARPNRFGGYSRQGVTGNALDAPGLWMFSRELLAYVAVGVAVVPLAMAAAWALQTFVRPLTREQHAFAVMATVTVVLATVVVGGFTAHYTPQGINSRYLFYVAPLLFIGMVALVADRRPATWPLVLAVAGVAWLVYGATISQTGPSLVSPEQTFHTVLAGRSGQIGKALGLPQASFPHLMAVGGVIVVVLLALLRRGRAGRAFGVAVLAAVTLFCVAETVYSMQKIADTQAGVSQDFIDGRRWIDAALPPGAEAQVFASTLGDPGSAYGVWWDISFWNRTVDHTLYLPTTPDLQQPFPQPFAILPDGRFIGVNGGVGVGDGPYFVKAVNDRSFAFRDAQVVTERFGVQLLQTTSPPRADWQLALTLDDTGRIAQGAPAAFLAVFPRTPGEREIPVTVTLGTWPADQPARYRVGRQRGRIPAGKTVTVHTVARYNPTSTYVWARIKAVGKLDLTRGVQVLGVSVG